MAQPRETVRILAIAGPSGSGKTTFARAVQAALAPRRSVVIPHDDYYRALDHLPLEDRAACNFDDPAALETELLVAHLEALRRGEVVRKPLYDFTTHARRPEMEAVEPSPVLIVEGVLVLSDPRLSDCADLSVYMDTPLDICLARRVLRDVGERGRTVESVINQYLATVRPALQRHVLPFRELADIVVAPDGSEAAVAEVAQRVRATE